MSPLAQHSGQEQVSIADHVTVQHSLSTSRDEIDLAQLWRTIWAGRWLVLSVAAIVTVLIGIYAMSLPNIYQSDALLAAAEENSGGGLSGMTGGLGGLASLAGVKIGPTGTDKTTLAIEVLQSRDFLKRFVQKHDLLVPLMAVTGWNSETDKLIYSADRYNVQSQTWQSPGPPSLQQAQNKLRSLISIEQDALTNLVRAQVDFYSPKIAQQWLELLIQDINAEIKRRDVRDATKSIEFLTAQLDKTALADMQTVFYELIEQQTKTIMFANVREQYVFKIVDSPLLPETKHSPRRSFILVLGAILGGLLGLAVLALVRYRQNARKHDDPIEPCDTVASARPFE